jgi:hypothetical protein
MILGLFYISSLPNLSIEIHKFHRCRNDKIQTHELKFHCKMRSVPHQNNSIIKHPIIRNIFYSTFAPTLLWHIHCLPAFLNMTRPAAKAFAERAVEEGNRSKHYHVSTRGGLGIHYFPNDIPICFSKSQQLQSRHKRRVQKSHKNERICNIRSSQKEIVCNQEKCLQFPQSNRATCTRGEHLCPVVAQRFTSLNQMLF